MNFGLIGDGRIANRHKIAIKNINGSIVNVFDPIYGEKHIKDSFFDDIEWVVICAPTYTHYDYVKLSLSHGKKVICEKPYVLPWQPLIDGKNV